MKLYVKLGRPMEYPPFSSFLEPRKALCDGLRDSSRRHYARLLLMRKCATRIYILLFQGS